ncbi:hypothetical protein DICSQDRAFT_151176 [Dichomitus squalens LYAD-421 SS1]|uniref:uncharacterized protein n=1 Tax=Dichomitus squalens (strain LYAD-421) TaxID=732165 RepID=UPI00044161D5|nr:uncharacterized protein DICSQDRAFT_151176 [Dichomitus squalens LYAD-421 SS1]EJF66745.1 hypothetical protein DICSQDRAFT_151176 [Dichomitus squalens LYAD-421 SS1]
MSLVRDFLAPPSRPNVPLTRVTSAKDPDYHQNNSPSTQPGPSTTLTARPGTRRTTSLPQTPAPPYDEDDEFNSRAIRRSADRSRLYPPDAREAASHSVCSTATSTPIPSRAPSPFLYYSGTSSCDSDSESEPESPLLGEVGIRRRSGWLEDERPRWRLFRLGAGGHANVHANGEIWRRRRRRWRDFVWGLRSSKRLLRRLVRHPFFPKTPVTILLTLLLFAIFGVSLTFLLIYILNPDKEPLPWRGYCTLPQRSAGPPSLSLSPTAFLQTPLPTNFSLPSFPPDGLDSLAPAGVFVGVFSMDTSVERRMLIRSTWASHVRSREGAGFGDGGVGTSRTIVRFILAQPQKEWERRVKLEMEMYKDMVILPLTENMNDGKTHAFFSWAANHSWVPPIYLDSHDKVPTNFTYLNATNPAPALAQHDPVFAHRDQLSASPRPWVRPDFVVKADDDSFVMLAELESRLRVELYKEPLPRPPSPPVRSPQWRQQSQPRDDSGEEPSVLDYNQIASYFNFSLPAYVTGFPTLVASRPTPEEPPSPDPLIFWGYLVKNRFMAGELYALSWSLVEWVSKDPLVKTMTRGAEDKQTSKWIRIHPRAGQVRWTSERCWIYDHPRAGTVYSHGFLFPSEMKRVQEGVLRDLQRLAQQTAVAESSAVANTLPGQHVAPPEKWTHSTVSKFHVRYSPPVADLNLDYSVEALVEGSDMSMVHDDGSMTADLAWQYREGRQQRYLGQRVGGTVVVHFIKKNMWFLETAAALLHGEDVTPLERALGQTRRAQQQLRTGLGDSSVDGVIEAAEGQDSSLSLSVGSQTETSPTPPPPRRNSLDSSTHTKARTKLRRLARDRTAH